MQSNNLILQKIIILYDNAK